ncbi:hypothetical protein QE152_g27604 [Popillia japonica]|uniref:Uncharacterized protein n=1 Tax=Popillia japonica TaxID=7064 RepID=A0AAW1JUL9_POPJA
MSVGKINEFDVSTKKWSTYIARLEQYFKVNKIEENMKVPTLLTVAGDTTYELMVDLCSPKKPEEKGYQELVNIVQEHLQPTPSIIAERHKFRIRMQQKGESVTQYMAALKHLAKSCEFKESLDDNLRDQFVSGLQNEMELNYLSAYEIARNMEAAEKNVLDLGTPEKALNYLSAYEIARNMEAAEKNVLDLGTPHHVLKLKYHGGSSCSGIKGTSSTSSSQRRAQQSSSSNFNVEAGQKNSFECNICGRRNHTSVVEEIIGLKTAIIEMLHVINADSKIDSNVSSRSKNNYIKDSKIDSNVSSRSFTESKNNYIKDSKIDSNVSSRSFTDNSMVNEDCNSDSSANLFNIVTSSKLTPIKISVKIENRDLTMEIDTGSPVSLISYNTYRKCFHNVPINGSGSPVSLISYNTYRTHIETKGFLSVKVQFNDVSADLKLYVGPNGGPSLLGRQ